MELRQYVIKGLGHISALIADDAAGMAAVVDPRRDVDIYLRETGESGLRISHVVETHLHNDYVSGARELAALTGARHVIGAGAELGHEHEGLRHGAEFDVGPLRFRALDTPGHTPEHVAYSVADRSRADEPALLFTGGSLLVGAVGRTDLLGAERAEEYARQMHGSLHEHLLVHEDYVGVLPTHGGGSLCSKDISTTPSSTLGYERRHNGLLGISEVEDFVRALLQDQPAYPRYFARMRPINKAGPAPLGSISPPVPMSAGEARALLAEGGLAVDLRAYGEYAQAHLPGALSIPAGSSFGTWLGWVVPHDRPLLLVLRGPEQWDDALRQALRIGHENVRGYLHGGMAAWLDAGGEVEHSGTATVGQLGEWLAARNGKRGAGPPLVIDVRQRDEYERGHVPGALHIMAGELPQRLAELPRDRPLVTICAAGYRSGVAAGLLRQAGFEDVTSVAGGVPAWRAAGLPTERGTE
ncbi:MAG TPA: rhodanese-like domain-containing protein [Candidatus Limnocylindria bacterium]|nr:rhodanese-like domain-containing protein [Candidatus Limnocylindria bacterium]